ncbi:MAG: MAPEG family protein [Steroidobacteraceae bacterium]
MSPELKYLALVSVLTGLLWVPYILNEILVRGLLDAVGYPENPKPLAKWAQRLKAAHYNAVENLVVFAPLVLIAAVAGIHDAAVATAACVYFWARVVHAAAYTLAVPWLRTVAFVVGCAMQLWIAYTILMR